MQSGVRMGGVAHAERDVRAGIIRRIRRRRDETVQIKIGIGRQMYHFLAWRRALKFNRYNRLFYAVIQHFSKTLRLAVQQGSHAFPACQNTNRNAGVRVPFYVAKNHRRAFFRRTLYGPARTDVTVNTGKAPPSDQPQRLSRQAVPAYFSIVPAHYADLLLFQP